MPADFEPLPTFRVGEPFRPSAREQNNVAEALRFLLRNQRHSGHNVRGMHGQAYIGPDQFRGQSGVTDELCGVVVAFVSLFGGTNNVLSVRLFEATAPHVLQGDAFNVYVHSTPMVGGRIGMHPLDLCHPTYEVGGPVRFSQQSMLVGTGLTTSILITDWWATQMVGMTGCPMTGG